LNAAFSDETRVDGGARTLPALFLEVKPSQSKRKPRAVSELATGLRRAPQLGERDLLSHWDAKLAMERALVRRLDAAPFAVVRADSNVTVARDPERALDPEPAVIAMVLEVPMMVIPMVSLGMLDEQPTVLVVSDHVSVVVRTLDAHVIADAKMFLRHD